jgi:hypothetical protein
MTTENNPVRDLLKRVFAPFHWAWTVNVLYPMLIV